MRLALFLSVLLTATVLIPMTNPVSADTSDEVLVCCDASPVELYLLGSDSQRKLTPFISELGDESSIHRGRIIHIFARKFGALDDARFVAR